MSNYRDSETMYLLPIYLYVAGFLDLPLVIEKIGLILRLRVC